jgi:membrane-associated phospholipid phosphatase
VTTRPVPTSPTVRSAWNIALSAGAGLLALYTLAVWTMAGQIADTRAMMVAGSVLSDAMWTDALLELISPATVLAALCLIVAAALGLRGPAAAASAGATVVATMIASELLKLVLVRPDWFDDAGNSLPSGHVSAVAGLAVAAYVAVPRPARAGTAAAGAVLVAATGAATMALGWHRPSDAAASVLLAVGVGAAVTYVSAGLTGCAPSSSGARGPHEDAPVPLTSGTW